LWKSYCFKCFVCQADFTLIRLFDTIIDESHALVWTANCGQAPNLGISTEKWYCRSSVNTAERVSNQMNLGKTFLLLELL
jgi:hypothetical protein